MLTFRKILLCDKTYFILFSLTILLTIFTQLKPKQSHYQKEPTQVVGKIIEIQEKEEKINLYLKQKEIFLVTTSKNNHIQLGDTIKVEGNFKSIKQLSSSMKKSLERKNIFYTITTNNMKIIRKNKNIYYTIKQKIRNRLNQNPYLYTYLLGDKSLLSQEVKRSYQENGISHLFAISGMHISLLVNILKKLLKKSSEKSQYKVISCILIVYLSLVGLSSSIVRGILFYELFTLNQIHYFYIKKSNLFLLTLSFALIISPSYIWDIGFWYSYTISFSLIMCSKYLESKQQLFSLLKVSTLSFMASTPITLYQSYQINLLSIIYNLFYVPLVSYIIFPLSILTSIIKPLEILFNFFTNILEKSSLYISHISIGKLTFKKLPFIIYIIYFILVILLVTLHKKEILIIFISLLIFHYSLPYFDPSTYVKFLDVEQGDSLLIHTKKQNIIIDTGGKSSQDGTIFYQYTQPELKKDGIKKINTLIISHGDYDHMGEAINLVENFKVEKVIFNCGTYNNLEKELIKVLDKKKIKYYSCIKELNIDKNKLYFLQTKEYDNENDNSNVIYTEINGYKFMLMGDASSTTEKEILSKYNLPDIDVLKVGHHGSKTSSSKEFMNEINPKYSIISVGKNNRYGHPNKEVLENLKNSKIYRTDEDGSIMFKVKNNKLKIETCSP